MTKPEKLDHILSTEDVLMPSSGFLESVMERVREEAAAPPPIPFPWRRFVPGIVLAVAVLGWCGFKLVHLGLPDLHEAFLAQPHLSGSIVKPLEQVGWVALALGLSFASLLVARRMAGRSG
jgi:hypothetical protein